MSRKRYYGENGVKIFYSLYAILGLIITILLDMSIPSVAIFHLTCIIMFSIFFSLHILLVNLITFKFNKDEENK